MTYTPVAQQLCKSCRTSKRRPPLHPARPPPSLTHITTAPWDQRKPTYSHIIVILSHPARALFSAQSDSVAPVVFYQTLRGGSLRLAPAGHHRRSV